MTITVNYLIFGAVIGLAAVGTLFLCYLTAWFVKTCNGTWYQPGTDWKGDPRKITGRRAKHGRS